VVGGPSASSRGRWIAKERKRWRTEKALSLCVRTQTEADYHEEEGNCLTNKVSPVQRVCVENLRYTRTRKTRVVAHPRRTLDRCVRASAITITSNTLDSCLTFASSPTGLAAYNSRQQLAGVLFFGWAF